MDSKNFYEAWNEFKRQRLEINGHYLLLQGGNFTVLQGLEVS